MTTAIGVLCARVRVEEKQIITALGDAGVAAVPVPPASVPLPPAPAMQDLAALVARPDRTDGERAVLTVMIDRCANRAVGNAMLQALKGAGVEVLDAGLASTGTRLDVVTSLKRAGLPLPDSLLAFSESSGIEAAAAIGFPSTLLPIKPGTNTTALLDGDTADAVIEHRVVLGSLDEAIVLIQAGAPSAKELVRLHVVDGIAVAFDGEEPCAEMISLAQRASRAIGASFASIEIASVNGERVVWDVLPVADFRQSVLLGNQTVGEALASLASDRASRAATIAGGEGTQHVIALTA